MSPAAGRVLVEVTKASARFEQQTLTQVVQAPATQAPPPGQPAIGTRQPLPAPQPPRSLPPQG